MVFLKLVILQMKSSPVVSHSDLTGPFSVLGRETANSSVRSYRKNLVKNSARNVDVIGKRNDHFQEQGTTLMAFFLLLQMELLLT